MRALVSRKAMECSRAKASPLSISTCTSLITMVEMAMPTSLLLSKSALLPRRIKGTPGKPNSSMLPNHFPIPEKLTEKQTVVLISRIVMIITFWTG